MSVLVKPSGFTSGTAPDVMTENFATTSGVIFVDSVTGSDSNAGTREEAPKATVFGASGALASAVIVTATSAMVICKATHRETISAAYTFSKAGVTLISYGSGASVATFTSAVAGVAIDATGVDIRFENLAFAASTAVTTARIRASAAGMEVRDCTFDLGASDYTDTILINAVARCQVIGVSMTVVAAATSGTTQVGVRATGAALNFLLQDATFDGGAYGWTDSPFKTDNAGADSWRVRGLTLRNYSKVRQTTSGATGYLSNLTVDSTSGWDWVE